MPFTTADARSKNKSITTDSQARRWTAVANSVLDRCIKAGGTDKTCAPKAIRQANGVIKAQRMAAEQKRLDFDSDETPVGFVINCPDAEANYSQDLDRFRMHVATEGDWVHPTAGFRLPITRERMQKWIANHPRVKEHSGCYVPSRHSRTPEDNRGWVDDFEIDDGPDGKARLWAITDIRNEEAARGVRDGTIRGTSMALVENMKLSDGEGGTDTLDEAIEHVALTSVPVIGKQSPPEPIYTASVGDDDTEVQFYSLDLETVELQRQTVGKKPPQSVIDGEDRVSKSDANYRLGEAGQRCERCLFFTATGLNRGECSIVEGDISADRLSDFWRPRERLFAHGGDYDGEGKKRKKKKSAEAEMNRDSSHVFSSTHKNVADGKDHFALDSEDQAQLVLARSRKFSNAPSWYKGSLPSLKQSVTRAVKKKYPDIKVTEKPTTEAAQMALSNDQIAELAEKIGYDDVLPENVEEFAQALKSHFEAEPKSEPKSDPPAKKPDGDDGTQEFDLESHPKYLEMKGQNENLLSRMAKLEEEREGERFRELSRRKVEQKRRLDAAIEDGKTTQSHFEKMLSSTVGITGYKYELDADAKLDLQIADANKYDVVLSVVEQNRRGAVWPGTGEITGAAHLEADEEIQSDLERQREESAKLDKERDEEIDKLMAHMGHKNES